MSQSLVALEKILVEIETVIRLMPDVRQLHHETAENFTWIGRASAVVEMWGSQSPLRGSALITWRSAIERVHTSGNKNIGPNELSQIQSLLYRIQSELRFNTVGPVSAVVAKGQTFQYFDEVRKVVEQASSDILFIDPYLNADFISRYMPHVKAGTQVRLLGSKNFAALQAAVDAFAQGNPSITITARSGNQLHDRWLFVDRKRGFQSGASFKDGPLNAGTTITEIVDSVAAVMDHYESLWIASK